ncbi:hypothetical protein KKH43_04760 [Patescibacteria group bacterium]|nr:hypothetical protein [Patescibacteria group bacterium]
MVYTLIFDYYRYWYTTGFVRLLKYMKAYILILADAFSVKISFFTLLSPWKRDVSSLKGLPLDEKVKVIIFNVISRIFGAVLKLIILSLFLVFLVLLLAAELVIIVVWLFLPVVIIELIVIGILFILGR